MPFELSELIRLVRERDTRGLARAISVVEAGGPAARVLAGALYPYGGRAFIVGVTGPPGSGKSTLVDRLVRRVRHDGLTAAVVAVDPSSPYTGGAILGDRIRLHAHADDPGVFVRSMASRGALGGLSNGTSDAVVVLDAAGTDVIFLETVGVGQAEVDVMQVADVTMLVLVPEAGDDVQAMKAGVMEIADVIVVNKADRPDADRMVAAVEAAGALSSRPDARRPPVLPTDAVSDVGVDAVWSAVQAARYGGTPEDLTRRQRQRCEALVRDAVARLAVERVGDDAARPEWTTVMDNVVARRMEPAAAAARLVAHVICGREDPKG